MITGTSDYLTEITKTHVCAEHKAPLVVSWLTDKYVLRCGEGKGHYPEEVTKWDSLTDLWRQGRLADGPIKDNIERREKRKAMVTSNAMTLEKWGMIPKVDLGNNKPLDLEAFKFLIEWCEEIGLNARLGHAVYMYGKPYRTLEGLLYLAYKSERPFSLTSKPLNREELIIRGYGENDLGFVSTFKFEDTGATITGEGFITQEELNAIAEGKQFQKRYPVIASKPGPMGIKRADWQALRRAFPLVSKKEEEV